MIKLHTNHGVISLELDAEKAPDTAANFTQYVKDGHYNNTVFHRVIDGFMIQGGGFDKSLVQKETDAPIRNEWQNGLKNKRGTIAMARTNVPDEHSMSSPSRGHSYSVISSRSIRTGFAASSMGRPFRASR